MSISYSAPGKIILSGEHAVVYGKPAIVTAVNRRLTCTVTSGYHKQDKTTDFIAETVLNYLHEQGIPVKQQHFGLQTISKIPRKRGMGSSAAYSVASVAALLEFFSGSSEHPKETINNLAYIIEKRFHKNPSGVDQTTSCFGGLVYFRKEFEFLKGIYKLNFKLPLVIEKDLYLIDSGKPSESTAEMVGLVGRLYNTQSQKAQRIMNDIEKATKRLTVSIVKEDRKFFDDNLAFNGKLLIELGVVSQSTQKMLREVSPFGVGKITGAGGFKTHSGFIIFSAKDENGLRAYCRRNKVRCMKLTQSHVGVQKA